MVYLADFFAFAFAKNLEKNLQNASAMWKKIICKISHVILYLTNETNEIGI